MKVAVIGTGFVGVVTAAVLAKVGYQVWGLDVDAEKIAQLKAGRLPFFEPQLKALVIEGFTSKRLRFTIEYDQAISPAEVIMITVGTPSAKNGTADLTYVMEAAEALAPYLQDKAIVVIKSTVPPGTNQLVREIIEAKSKREFFIAAVPEFLKEGSAVNDSLNPDRVVIGAEEAYVVKKLIALHRQIGGERVVVSAESAQMAKYTANAYLAQRITFINQIANLCERNGAKISEVIKVIGEDKRIGSHYWYPGLGYGGSCFPKDVKELAAYAKSIGEGQGLLPKIDQLNEERMDKKIKEFERQVGGFKHKKVAVLGLAFKPNTNDLRSAPSLALIPYLFDRGASVSAYDPKVKEAALRHFPGLILGQDAYQAAAQAEVICLLTEWPEFKTLNLNQLGAATRPQAWLIDTRNLYQKAVVEAAGLQYIGIGNG
ncbi:hypothetical protein A2W24_00895 [Microgenomates group bacterium RBG_16_45_19]|nr:MAG: hypothetical protein A2W24_00895 [Microgenomates group bacterium RBG_16_45_19]